MQVLETATMESARGPGGEDLRHLARHLADDLVELGTVAGSDYDLATRGTDPSWAMRLRYPRLLGRLRYDATGIQWYVERDESVGAIDTLEDEHGIGRYAFPTAYFFDSRSPGTIAAYLCIKRGVKGIPLEPSTE